MSIPANQPRLAVDEYHPMADTVSRHQSIRPQPKELRSPSYSTSRDGAGLFPAQE